MLQILFLLAGCIGLFIVVRSFNQATDTDDLTRLSDGQIKHALAYAKMVSRNNSDETKRQEAARRIDQLSTELERRKEPKRS
jgi:hypothetical protein